MLLSIEFKMEKSGHLSFFHAVTPFELLSKLMQAFIVLVK